MSKVQTELVPEARRTRFPRWHGPRLSERTRKVGLKGIAAARKELEEHTCDHRCPPDCKDD